MRYCTHRPGLLCRLSDLVNHEDLASLSDHGSGELQSTQHNTGLALENSSCPIDMHQLTRAI